MVKNPILIITRPQPPQFDLTMTDDALVTFGAPIGPGALSFTDAGYMPVNTLTIGGTLQDLKGKLDGLFIHYDATGVQQFAATGVPTTADYTTLHYELVGYKGEAIFGHDADGTPTVSDVKHLTVLAQGDLIAGHLAFTAAGGIAGDVKTSMQVGGQSVGLLDLSVNHVAGDIIPSRNGFTLSGGTLHAIFCPLNG